MIRVTKILEVQLNGHMEAKYGSKNVEVLINPAHIVLVEPFKLIERKKDKNIEHKAVRVYLYGLAPEILCHSFEEFWGMLPIHPVSVIQR
jgi:hypothetical protein